MQASASLRHRACPLPGFGGVQGDAHPEPLPDQLPWLRPTGRDTLLKTANGVGSNPTRGIFGECGEMVNAPDCESG